MTTKPERPPLPASLEAKDLAEVRGCVQWNHCYRECTEAAQETLNDYTAGEPLDDLDIEHIAEAIRRAELPEQNGRTGS